MYFIDILLFEIFNKVIQELLLTKYLSSVC